jgi:hypothetical protein
MKHMTQKIVHFIESIQGWLSIAEGRYLANAVKVTNHLPGVIVEIGSYCGKSTIWLAQEKKKVYAIDPHEGEISRDEKIKRPASYKTFLKNLKKAQVFHNVQPIVKTSEQAAKTWEKQIRVLFIDALHDEKNASQDFKLWSSHVVDGGIIAIHDSFMKWCGSEKVAVRKIVLSPDYYKIGYVDSIIYGVKGKGTIQDIYKKFFMQIFILLCIETHHVYILMQLVLKSLRNS